MQDTDRKGNVSNSRSNRANYPEGELTQIERCRERQEYDLNRNDHPPHCKDDQK